MSHSFISHQSLSHAPSAQDLAEQIGRLLIQLQARVTCAESCTGGGIAKAFTDVSGCSQWFDFGCVVYSNEVKNKILGVDEQSLIDFGAVSPSTTRQMVSGALDLAEANYAVAVSGIAGPTGGSAQKPVGTICFSWGAKGRILSESTLFTGTRKQIRKNATRYALQRLSEFLQEDYKNTV